MTNRYYKNFENLLDDFMKGRPEELDKVVEETTNKIRGRSIGEVLSLGKEYLENNNYMGAITSFNEVKKDKKTKYLGELYNYLVFVIINSRVDKDSVPQDFRQEVDSLVLEKIIYCMMESTRMYAEKEIPKEELFSIEFFIDRIQFRDMTIKDRTEFNRIYNKFKEYALDVFTEDKDGNK
ncbi:MAG: hypothetical protein PHQ66_02660 [Candidatus Nanoarchaeia archaeon]|nr:hypothetical protein [Candidatus Nanoarchaeia archaeon]MDD5357731.1 hypothetical protein [Candidatus Nanoarchaeia archaeon]MDD5588650.1 hypothetical protein [Candidatus Nanoarchaeia archaeon]